MKQYLQCVGYTVAVMLILSTIFITITYIGVAFESKVIGEVYDYCRGVYDEYGEVKKPVDKLIEIGKNFEEPLIRAEKNDFARDKEKFGEDFPSLGLTLYRLTFMQANEIITINIFAILVGIIFGTIYYIIGIKKVKGKKLIIELIIALISIIILIETLLFIYNLILNHAVKSLISNENDNSFIIYSELNIVEPVIMLFVLTVVIIYIGNMILSFIITKRLNDELNRSINKK